MRVKLAQRFKYEDYNKLIRNLAVKAEWPPYKLTVTF